MPRQPDGELIRLRGVRQNNLKGFDLDLPVHRLIVVTGLSGSGKSSLAFDTLYAEGQRRYIETFSPYARQFFDRMDKPRVDRISGIPPAIAIEQRNAVRTTRSTVGTMTEICDYLKVLWPRLAQLHCRQCGQPVKKEPPHHIWEQLNAEPGANNAEVLITFEVPVSEKLSLPESLALVAKQGFQRLLVGGQMVHIEEAESALGRPAALTVIQDRLKLAPGNRARFVEGCEQAYHFGKGRLAICFVGDQGLETGGPLRFSAGLHCATCNLDYREPSPALFSFNHPLGACPACKGFGRIISIDYNLALPDRRKTLAQGVVRPWQTGFSAECQGDLMKFCKAAGIPTNVPFCDLKPEHQAWVTQGEPDYGTDEEHEWPRAWYGVKGYFRWLESKSYKMHVRVLLSRYRAYTTCPECHGARLKPEALLYRLRPQDEDGGLSMADGLRVRSPSSIRHPLSSLSLSDFYGLPIADALGLMERVTGSRRLRPAKPKTEPASGSPHSAPLPPSALDHALREVRFRLQYLVDVGLGYLTLDRPTRTLSGGETERVNLTSCLGTHLVNTLYVLDEPSVGLHPRDTVRLVRLLEQLRDHGNTVVVVEHEASVMRAADQIVDLGPGHGATGGELVFQGTYREILKCKESLTGQYLSGRKGREERGTRNAERGTATLRLSHATRHNLNNVAVEIPLNRLVVVTGVSGSGKTTLVRELLFPLLQSKLGADAEAGKASDRLDATERDDSTEPESTRNPEPETRNSPRIAGHERLARVLLVDQSALGKTPRSNPAVYTGAFDDIREVFAQSEAAKQRGLNASAFSFNSAVGQCARCRGAGFEKIEMQFLSDVFIRCPDCNGRRYQGHILEVKVKEEREARNAERGTGEKERRDWSIADVLEGTVDEAVKFFGSFAASKAARRAVTALTLLQDVGLGYLALGQPINTLSGGESQRLKLAAHLAEAAGDAAPAAPADPQPPEGATTSSRPTLFIFDEPTTGLHFDDVRVLLRVFHRLVHAGHSVVVIEHNLDVIRDADWVIDLGPEAGAGGGQVVAVGTPEDIAKCAASHTGRFLRERGAENAERGTGNQRL
jgi:excinuclease ABC subunit A